MVRPLVTDFALSILPDNKLNYSLMWYPFFKLKMETTACCRDGNLIAEEVS